MSILVVTKKSKLDYYRLDLERDQENTVKVSRDDYEKMLRYHGIHYNTMDGLQEILTKNNVTYDMKLREDLTYEDIIKSDAVIAAGGDGTYMGAAYYIKDKTPILGIKMSPDSVGAHMELNHNNYKKKLEQFVAGDYISKEKTRVQGRIISTMEHIDHAVNEVAVGDYVMFGHFRHSLFYQGQWTKTQGASLVIASTYDGRGGWYENMYHLPDGAAFNKGEENMIRFRLVSPATQGDLKPEVRFGVLKPGEKLLVKSYLIETGSASFDGSKDYYPKGRVVPFNRGSIAEISHSDRPLNAVVFK